MTYLQTVVKPERLLTTAHTCLFGLYSKLHLPGLDTTSWNLSSLSTPHTAQQRAEANSEKLPIVCGVARIWRGLIGQKWRIHRSKTFRYRTPQVLKPPRVRTLQRISKFVIVNKAESPTTISRAQKPPSQCTNFSRSSVTRGERYVTDLTAASRTWVLGFYCSNGHLQRDRSPWHVHLQLCTI
jgi:hypothetical protein